MTLHGVIPQIVREHVELAAFQWSQHRMLLQAHPPDNAAIAHVSARLSVNLDGIRIAGEAAWPIIIDRFEDFPEEGELFVASHLAMVLKDDRRIHHCLRLADQSPGARAGLAGALAGFPPAVSGPIVKSMLRANSPVIRAVALDVLVHHRADAGGMLIACLSDPSPILRSSACALAAVTGRSDCGTLIVDLAKADEADLRFAAISALAALGHPAAPDALKIEIEGGERATDALRLLHKLMLPEHFLSYLGGLYQHEGTRALAVRGIGMTGDRGRLDWLIKQMALPLTAFTAGESFLELYPEAAEVEGLFSADPTLLGPELAQACEASGSTCPVAAAISRWAEARPISL